MSLAAPERAGSTSTSPTARGLWLGGRGVFLVALLVVAVAVTGVLLGGSGQEGRPLDPADTSLSGGKGLARLLQTRDVRVARVTSVAEAESQARQAGSAGSTLLVSDTSPLDEAEAERLAATPSDLLLVGVRSHLERLAPGVSPAREVRARSREPRCALPAATRAGSAHIGGMAFTPPAGATGCYPADGRPTLVSQTTGDRQVTVMGDGQFMTNLRLAEDGNAALAMNLAGGRPTLIWLTAPETAPRADGTAGFYDLIPEGVRWAVVQVLVAVLLLALWRGRRLGPVVAERLPVVVRAAETVEGRARLYRARRARDRAAAALRTSFIDRVTPRLGLPSRAGADALVNAIAERTGQAAPHVGAALYGPPPVDEAGLVALAEYMDIVERQVGKS
ncbi:DUF4350 domain-containing protein [Streptosporangium sp. NBC_01755]|uniref:DUF4350 domain-containing protein n=1 Tax=unclassified Streptosporangium TaxID=2632669 RepID=UPI002DDB925E|nr:MULTISPECIES: DUF4350 domain-containing protein [unclassified Streptosporangium]WSA24098.1 DUF4350 domain-containing protein [Streptosporangium sp. NBC_01810]WSC97830.1 DUF4350 domain-containing protein [Streptosporangium sp. NBC_01755]